MRWQRGSIAISDTRDIPLLLMIRNARAITSRQIWELARIERYESKHNNFWRRLSRLEEAGLIRRLSHGRSLTLPVFAITAPGLEVLEGRGHALATLSSNAREIVPQRHIPHSLELVQIRVAMARQGILRRWTSEVEIASRNISCEGGAAKDYDALVEVSVGGETRSFALELERTLKASRSYKALCRVFEADPAADRILYLAPGPDILAVLALELRGTGRRMGFALSRSLQGQMLETGVLTNYSGDRIVSLRDFLLHDPSGCPRDGSPEG